MLSMTNKFYNQMKSRLPRAATAPEVDAEQGPAEAATNVEQPANRRVDKRESAVLHQVVFDKPQHEFARPPLPRPGAQSPAANPPRPYYALTPEEV